MNQGNRKTLSAIVNQIAAESNVIDTVIQKLGEGRAPEALHGAEIIPVIAALRDCYDQIEEAQSEEQDKFDNMSDGLQQSDTGAAIEAAAEALQDAMTYLQSALSTLEDPGEWSELGDTLQGVLDNDLADAVGSIDSAING